MVERREITDEEREALQRFLRCEISLEALLLELHGMVEIEFLSTVRRLTSHFNLVEPPIRVAKTDVDNAIAKRRSGALTERDLVRWATGIVLNDTYLWEGEDEDEISDALNDLSLGGLELYEKSRRAK
jgi:hypothetical protein